MPTLMDLSARHDAMGCPTRGFKRIGPYEWECPTCGFWVGKKQRPEAHPEHPDLADWCAKHDQDMTVCKSKVDSAGGKA